MTVETRQNSQGYVGKLLRNDLAWLEFHSASTANQTSIGSVTNANKKKKRLL